MEDSRLLRRNRVCHTVAQGSEGTTRPCRIDALRRRRAWHRHAGREKCVWRVRRPFPCVRQPIAQSGGSQNLILEARTTRRVATPPDRRQLTFSRVRTREPPRAVVPSGAPAPWPGWALRVISSRMPRWAKPVSAADPLISPRCRRPAGAAPRRPLPTWRPLHPDRRSGCRPPPRPGWPGGWRRPPPP